MSKTIVTFTHRNIKMTISKGHTEDESLAEIFVEKSSDVELAMKLNRADYSDFSSEFFLNAYDLGHMLVSVTYLCSSILTRNNSYRLETDGTFYYLLNDANHILLSRRLAFDEAEMKFANDVMIPKMIKALRDALAPQPEIITPTYPDLAAL